MTKLTEQQKLDRKKKREENKALLEAKSRQEANENARERFVRQVLMNQHIKANRVFEVGEEVEAFGANWNDVVIEEIIVPELAYKVKHKLTIPNYGNPIVNTSYSYVQWFELRKKDKPKHSEHFHRASVLKRFDFFQSPISSLIYKVTHTGVDFNPEYQRDLVWDMKDKELLIESIFEGRDIGKFVFCFLGYVGEKTYEILDGKQRLSTIIEFITDQFPYKGVYYSDLQHRDQHEFENLRVGLAETREVLTLEEKCECFLSLNTTGKVQSQEHLDYVKSFLKD